jgi:hypothetical protein
MPDGHDEANELPLISGEGARLKKAIGWPSWTSTAPNPCDDASHSTVNCLLKSGMARTGAEVTAALRASKAAAASSDQENPSFFRRAVSGAATVP